MLQQNTNFMEWLGRPPKIVTVQEYLDSPDTFRLFASGAEAPIEMAIPDTLEEILRDVGFFVPKEIDQSYRVIRGGGGNDYVLHYSAHLDCDDRREYLARITSLEIYLRHCIPGLDVFSLLPISELTIDKLRLYQDIQIFRGKIRTLDGIRRLSDDDRLAAVRRLAAKIPLKLANPEAHDALTRMIGRGDPYTKSQIRDALLPELFYEQLKGEKKEIRRRINRTQYIKTPQNDVAQIAPGIFPLREYWGWLQDGVQKALEAFALENESKDKSKIKIVYGVDYDREIWEDGQAENLAIQQGNPDEANITFDGTRGWEGVGLADDDEFAADSFEDDIGDRLEELRPSLDDLAREIKIDPVVVLDTVKSDLNPRDREYITKLLRTFKNDPGLSLPEARKRTREKMKIAQSNERQIWFRFKHYSGVKGRHKYIDAIAAPGHTLLRPDGTEMHIPAWALGLLRRLNLLLDSGPVPQLSPAIWIILGKTVIPIAPTTATTNPNPAIEPTKPQWNSFHKEMESANLPSSVYRGISPTTHHRPKSDLFEMRHARHWRTGTVERLVLLLGRNLEGPKTIVCDCPRCRF